MRHLRKENFGETRHMEEQAAAGTPASMPKPGGHPMEAAEEGAAHRWLVLPALYVGSTSRTSPRDYPGAGRCLRPLIVGHGLRRMRRAEGAVGLGTRRVTVACHRADAKKALFL